LTQDPQSTRDGGEIISLVRPNEAKSDKSFGCVSRYFDKKARQRVWGRVIRRRCVLPAARLAVINPRLADIGGPEAIERREPKPCSEPLARKALVRIDDAAALHARKQVNRDGGRIKLAGPRDDRTMGNLDGAMPGTFGCRADEALFFCHHKTAAGYQFQVSANREFRMRNQEHRALFTTLPCI